MDACSCAAPEASASADHPRLGRALRAVEPVMRGPVVVVLAAVVFSAGGAVGGRAGLALVSALLSVMAGYCLLNFWHCRETHCAVTGPGWALTALLGFVAVVTPGAALSWYRVNVASGVFLAVLAAGILLELGTARRTGSRTLGRRTPAGSTPGQGA